MKPSETLSQLVGQTLSGVSDDLAQARQGLHDGITRLTTSFHSLREQLHAQGDELKRVATVLDGQQGDAGFIRHMNVIVSRFVDDLVTVSTSSVRMVARVDEMATDVQQVVRNIDRIEALAGETRFIALNARIEAHRVGEQGLTFRVVADEVRALADDAGRFVAEIRTQVDSTSRHLVESRQAVSKLASHDMNGALEAQRQVLTALEQLAATNTRVTTSLDQVEAQIGETVRALQFEDMVSQLLDSASRRLDAVKAVWLEWVARAPAPNATKASAELSAISPNDEQRTT
jgi:methyl-accepting chemotaxis protein